jgi:hypothetical protein
MYIPYNVNYNQSNIYNSDYFLIILTVIMQVLYLLG